MRRACLPGRPRRARRGIEAQRPVRRRGSRPAAGAGRGSEAGGRRLRGCGTFAGEPRAMAESSGERSAARWLARAEFQRLVDALRGAGHRVLGPTLRDGAVVSTRSRRSTSCRSAGATSRRRAAIGSPGAARRAVRRRERPRRAEAPVFAPREPLLQIEMDAASGPAPFRAEPIAPDAERARDPRRARLRPRRRSRCRTAIFLRRSLPRSDLRGAPRAPVPRRRRLHALGRRPASARRWTPARSRARAATTSR